ncbi:hypothetical protein CDV36_013423 [Fusarium kuroshium]|uniref:WHIM1 domain-containing protein n=1 Tax=Fusarium kuroshium TaxID=2010991 RepID=A0A3M2RNT7_9HYPO|nr:hypothetical protein CDV36_013423 [Fusarium kuroshium]
MSADDDSSDLSSLSSLSPAPSDIELDEPADLEAPKAKSKKGIQKYFSTVAEQPPKEPTPPPRKRSPSPPHEYVLADNPDIAFIVMFRSRFHDEFPKSLAHFGPQELERDVVEAIPGDRVEHFLCALLGLLLNRKQDVKPGHYGRALEDAISTHKNQWAPAWEDKNPLSGGATFTSMNPTQRLTLLRTLILWTLSSSETVKGLINQSYKQNRHEDDSNQPRSVQPWGSDGDKRRYFLIEGQDDTAFRIYRESNPAGTKRTWWSVAGTIDELKALAEKLEVKDGGPKARKLAQKMISAVPRFEAGEEKRKRREYRQMRKEQFKRPEPGFSLYEGRTRGKKMKYTYSDDEDIFSDSTTRRSARNTGTHTPVETGPVTTSSGRQIRAPTRLNPATGSSAPGSVQGDTSEVDKENSVGPTGRPRRSAAVNHGTSGWAGTSNGSRRKTADDSENESEAEFGDDEEDVDEHVPEESEDEDEFDEDEAMVDDDLNDSTRSLVVKLSVTPPKLRSVLAPNSQARNKLPTPSSERGGDKAEASEAPLVEMEDAPATELETKKAASKENEPVGRVSPAPDTKFAERQAATPASIHATPLAFRGSPEKSHVQPVPRPLDIGTSRE